MIFDDSHSSSLITETSAKLLTTLLNSSDEPPRTKVKKDDKVLVKILSSRSPSIAPIRDAAWALASAGRFKALNKRGISVYDPCKVPFSASSALGPRRLFQN